MFHITDKKREAKISLMEIASMFCNNCGKPVDEKSVYCGYCGAKIGQLHASGAAKIPNTMSATKSRKRIKSPLAVSITIVIVSLLGIGLFFIIRGLSRPSIGDIIEFGELEWRVLDVKGGRALVITEYIVGKTYYGYNTRGVIGRLEYLEVTWADSNIRQYLNEHFYFLFSSTERAQIQETQISNGANPWYGTNGGVDTTDKIFLLSIEEVMKYFGDSGQLESQLVDSGYIVDRYNENRVASYERSYTEYWWLRTPGKSIIDFVIVDERGRIDIDGRPGYLEWVGVRPAMWLKL